MWLPLLLLSGLQLAASSVSLAANTTALAVSFPQLRYSPFVYKDRHYAIAAFAKVNWYRAHLICNNVGMALATVTNYEQHVQLLRRVEAQAELLQNKGFWLAGTNLPQPNEWTWLTNGLPIGRGAWAANEPRRSAQPGCLLLARDKRWYSAPCNQQFYFICENVCPLDSYAVPLYPAPIPQKQ